MTSGTVQGQDHEELRALLLSIAYRMVGSVTEAEDLVHRLPQIDLWRPD